MFNLPRVVLGALRLRQTSPDPIGVGTTLEARVVILGFESRVSSVITEWAPPHTFAISARGGGFRSIRETHEATADATKVVRAVEVEPGPVLQLLWPIFGPWFRRRSEASTRKIKRPLEAG